MLSFATPSQPATVPVGLLTAAIDLINVLKPARSEVDRLVTGLVLRLDYDRSVASALVSRIHATARMFADPRWASVRHWGRSGDASDRAKYDALVQKFIATAPLDATLTFDMGSLQRMLLVAMPPAGHG